MTSDILKQDLERFYDFLTSNQVRDFVNNPVFKEHLNDFKEGFEILKTNTSDFQDISEQKIIKIIEENIEKINEIIFALRMPLAISRMNMETYFVADMCSVGIFSIILKKTGNKNGIAYDFQGNEIKNTKYDDLIKLAKDNPIILKEIIKFFIKLDLILALKNYQGKKLENILEMTESLLTYSEKGGGAEKSGEMAERMIKYKLESWGLKKEIDFNKNDVYLKDILLRKIESLEKEKKIPKQEAEKKKEIIKKEKDTRQYDLIFPGIGEPKLISQVVFYSSNTGSEGSKKVSQNIKTETFIKKILEENEVELKRPIVIDGPGWIDMIGPLQTNSYLNENLLQINTVDTKLKKMLNNVGFVYPIDVEMGILELKLKNKTTSKEKVLEIIVNKDNITANKDEIISQNPQFFDGKDDEDVIELSKDRHEIGKKFLILEKLQEISPSNESQKFSVLIPSKTNLEISDTDIFINKDEIGLQDDEIKTILKELEEEGTIIIQTV